MFLQKGKCYSPLHQKYWQSESCMLDFVLPWHNDSQCGNAWLSPTILPHQKNWDRRAHVLTKYLNTALISGLSWHSSPHIWVPTSGSYQKVLRILKRRKKPFFSMFAIFAELHAFLTYNNITTPSPMLNNCLMILQIRLKNLKLQTFFISFRYFLVFNFCKVSNAGWNNIRCIMIYSMSAPFSLFVNILRGPFLFRHAKSVQISKSVLSATEKLA